MTKKSLLRFPVAILAAFALTLTGCADDVTSPELMQADGFSAAMEKSPVCHVDEFGVYNLITIADIAHEKHLEHGDALPGTDIPGMPGYMYSETDCTPEAGVVVSGADIVWTTGSPLTTYKSQVEVYADGSGTVVTEYANGDPFYSYQVTCLKIVGNEAFFAGTRNSDNAPVIFYALDGGETGDLWNHWTNPPSAYNCETLGDWDSGKAVTSGDLTIAN